MEQLSKRIGQRRKDRIGTGTVGSSGAFYGNFNRSFWFLENAVSLEKFWDFFFENFGFLKTWNHENWVSFNFLVS